MAREVENPLGSSLKLLWLASGFGLDFLELLALWKNHLFTLAARRALFRELGRFLRGPGDVYSRSSQSPRPQEVG